MLSAYDARPAGAPDAVQWTTRVRLDRQRGVGVAYCRDHTLAVAQPVSFKPSGDPAPSALESLLAALGGELLTGFIRRAERLGLTIDHCEATVAGWLENPLVAAGVVGEEGAPALAGLTLTLYVASPDDEPALSRALDDALRLGPVYATLSRACPIALTLHVTL